MTDLKIKVSRPVADGIINLSVSAIDADERVVWAYTRTFDMNAVGYGDVSELAQTAMAEGFGKALREATGGLTIQADSEKRVDARLAAWTGGKWGASAEGGEAVAFSVNSAEAAALAAAYPDRFATAGEAAGFLNSRLDAALDTAFAELGEKARTKARRKFSDAIIGKDVSYAAAFAAETSARQKAAVDRRAARITAAAAEGKSGGLFN
jgi:hypothetical protein